MTGLFQRRRESVGQVSAKAVVAYVIDRKVGESPLQKPLGHHFAYSLGVNINGDDDLVVFVLTSQIDYRQPCRLDLLGAFAERSMRNDSVAIGKGGGDVD